MRLICTIPKGEGPGEAWRFSQFLTSQKIDNRCEESAEGYLIWIYDEDDVEQGSALYRAFQENPSDPRFSPESPPEAPLAPPPHVPERRKHPRRVLFSPAPYGKVSLLILLACLLFYFISLVQESGQPQVAVPGVEEAPVLPRIATLLLFDYPLYTETYDTLAKLYSHDRREEGSPLDAAEERLVERLRTTPYWNGLYDRVVAYFKGGKPIAYHGPWMEKIREGEVWRLFTPALLHLNFLHIFFNILWFLLLANQIEFRIGSARFLLLVLVSGIVSNVGQYWASGPYFLGLSGVVCGVAGFIWARQRRAAWEGYLLPKSTLNFLLIFVIALCGLQVVLFFYQLWSDHALLFSIANTAHVLGGLSGYCLGCSSFFRITK